MIFNILFSKNVFCRDEVMPYLYPILKITPSKRTFTTLYEPLKKIPPSVICILTKISTYSQKFIA